MVFRGLLMWPLAETRGRRHEALERLHAPRESFVVKVNCGFT